MFDPCIYLKEVANKNFGLIILVLYMDDMLICAKEAEKIDKMKKKLG